MEMPAMLIVKEPIEATELQPLRAWHHDLVKGVADIEKKILALGGEWHMDANTALIADGSEQKNIWGFNIYPNESGDAAIAYESLINIRPAQGNTSMVLGDEGIRDAIKKIVHELIPGLPL